MVVCVSKWRRKKGVGEIIWEEKKRERERRELKKRPRHQ